MTSIAIILYEDERGPTQGFGLHELVIACVADDLRLEIKDVRKMVECRPMKGISKLLQTCRCDVRRMAARGQRVFAVIDDDHIREQLPGMDPRADDVTVIQAIRKQSDGPEQLEVILLHKNTESVINAASVCDREISQETVDLALRKNLMQRDRVLSRVAWGPQHVRACIRQKIAAMELIVQRLVMVSRGRLAP